jgi:tRNA(Ile)-lysidine synthase
MALEAAGAGSGTGSACPPFSYTLRVPGEVVVRESGAVVSLHRAPIADWMLRGAPQRAGLGLALSSGDEVTVRNRLPGDRMHPLGAPGSRRLKDLLIDRRVPRGDRDRLPLLCTRRDDGSERIAWVPGVAVDESCRLPAAGAAAGFAWVAEIASR